MLFSITGHLKGQLANDYIDLKAELTKIEGQGAKIPVNASLKKAADNAVKVETTDAVTGPQVMKVENEDVISILSEMAFDAEQEAEKSEDTLVDIVLEQVDNNNAVLKAIQTIFSAGPLGAPLKIQSAVQAMTVGDSETLFGANMVDIEEKLAIVQAKLLKEKAESEEKDKGKRVSPDWDGDDSHKIFVDKDALKEAMSILNKVIGDISKLLPTDFFAEPEGGYKGRERGIITSRSIDKFSLAAYKKFTESRRLHADNKEAVEFINRAFNKSENPKDEILIIPRVMIRHPLKEINAEESIIWSYEPQQMIQSFMKSGVLKSFFAEIPDDKVRAALLRQLEQPRVDTKDSPLPLDFNLAKKILRDGILHEISHSLVFHLTEEEETEFAELVEKGNKDRVFFKNWMKALKGIQHFRLVEKAGDKNFSNPNAVTWNLAQKLFITEMFCDWFPIYLKQQVGGEQHVYESDMGVKLTPELETFL